MRKSLLAFLLWAAFFAIGVAGAEVRCRSGVVTGGGISTAKPEIQNENRLAYPADYRRKLYAAVNFRLMPGRTLSIHDYSLEIDATKYQAVAIRRGYDAFSMYGNKIAPETPNQRVTLLFLLDGSRVNAENDSLSATLCANFPPENRSRCTIRLENRNGGSL